MSSHHHHHHVIPTQNFAMPKQVPQYITLRRRRGGEEGRDEEGHMYYTAVSESRDI